MAEPVCPVDVHIDAQRIGRVEEAEEIGAAGPHTLKCKSTVKLVPIADGFIHPQLQRVLMGVGDHRNLIVV